MTNYTIESIKSFIIKRALEDRENDKGKLKDQNISYVCDLLNELKVKEE